MEYTELVRKLQKLGFTENEAKIYIGLLGLGKATAREIHEFTHVPRPKIYATLRRMSKKKYVEVTGGTPAYFWCIGPEQLTERLRAEFLFSLSEILKELNTAGHGIKFRSGRELTEHKATKSQGSMGSNGL
ncbi:Transcriptional regulator, TrmB family [Methanosarcina horonobensis HB-1 = JCM 15518]|uniref:Transcriptional regulator, TrmB family n=1 Tax=Methanosarcina horonobensis HB-1 = JCM 15518 TaxID=1434110 RepID=A0A0E3SAS2_9EURY|nr:helix-turn-helix domain-containing protein [Methanosarcina horonobensis]AKB76787.1 Transcriptional regulator, TrmB family [Methanosarcina horonobensis HB-1 = JCM 15518]